MDILGKVRAPALVAGLAMFAGSPAHATDCTVSGVAGLAVPNLSLSTAGLNAAGACIVIGRVATTGFGAPNGSANFAVTLPPAALWNKKFLQFGQGGFAGSLSAATNAADPGAAAAQNYATAVTDTGHQAGSTDATWALLAPGVPDEAKLTDYYFRAVHEVAVAMKALVARFYASPLKRAYFDGCSNGGRQAFVEASKFPDDFDGIVAGDPFMDIRTILAGSNFDKIQLASANVYIPATKLPMIDAAVYKSCDAADGVVDHLIQNPTKCSFDPKTLVTPSCTGADTTCLTAGEANTLTKYLTALRDDDGNIVYTGETISDLSAGPQGLLDFNLGGMDFWTTGLLLPGQMLNPPAENVLGQTLPPNTQTTFDLGAKEPWGNAGFSPSPIGWQFVDHFIKFVVERDPNFDMRSYVHTVGRVSDAELKLFDSRSEAGDGDVPAKLIPFIEKGKKLLIYHGFSDPALTTTRTIKYYEDLAETLEVSFSELQENVRLFTVPGMHHCVGGPGPNFFDTLTPLDNWVDHGVAPDGIIATHFVGNNPPPVNNAPPDRTMPLCKFPEQARFSGTGDVNNAANWSCPPHDRGLLKLGTNGKLAGLGDHNRIAGSQEDDDR